MYTERRISVEWGCYTSMTELTEKEAYKGNFGNISYLTIAKKKTDQKQIK